ncbi:MAG: hypothetical protein OQK46_02445 [Gammaproteobacteria bacterium]|nr:hypothetical protein [Gammaproteobacteria bacterium]
MKNSFNITLNEKIIYSYAAKPAPARLRRYFDEIDNKMSKGIQLGEHYEKQPSLIQKLQYVSLRLFDAIETKDDNLIELLSAYLMSRNPDLKNILISENDNLINLKLI